MLAGEGTEETSASDGAELAAGTSVGPTERLRWMSRRLGTLFFAAGQPLVCKVSHTARARRFGPSNRPDERGRLKVTKVSRCWPSLPCFSPPIWWHHLAHHSCPSRPPPPPRPVFERTHARLQSRTNQLHHLRGLKFVAFCLAGRGLRINSQVAAGLHLFGWLFPFLGARRACRRPRGGAGQSAPRLPVRRPTFPRPSGQGGGSGARKSPPGASQAGPRLLLAVGRRPPLAAGRWPPIPQTDVCVCAPMARGRKRDARAACCASQLSG